jgi:hypothetical protein
VLELKDTFWQVWRHTVVIPGEEGGSPVPEQSELQSENLFQNETNLPSKNCARLWVPSPAMGEGKKLPHKHERQLQIYC